MATSSARRVVEPVAEPARSAERERLARAYAIYTAVAARLERLQSALGGAQSERFEQAIVIENIENEIAEAARVSQRAAVAELLGDPAPVGQTLEAVEGRLEEARDRQRRAKLAATALEQELAGITGMRSRYEGAQHELEVAVSEVVRAEVEAALVAKAMEAKMLFGAIRELGVYLKLRAWQLYNVEIPGIIPPEASLVPRWKQAVDQLRAGEIDAALPEIE